MAAAAVAVQVAFSARPPQVVRVGIQQAVAAVVPVLTTPPPTAQRGRPRMVLAAAAHSVGTLRRVVVREPQEQRPTRLRVRVAMAQRGTAAAVVDQAGVAALQALLAKVALVLATIALTHPTALAQVVVDQVEPLEPRLAHRATVVRAALMAEAGAVLVEGR